MNRTHRGLNRLLLALVGVLFLAAGAVMAFAGANADIAREWTRTGTDLMGSVHEWMAGATIGGQDTSWWTVAAAGVLLLVAIMLVGWLAAHGGGRTNQLARQSSKEGTTTVDAGLAAQAIRTAFADNKHVLSTSVQAWELAGGSGLKISLQARKGASPKELIALTEELVGGLDALLGETVPVLIRIKAGNRSRFSGTERVS